MTPIAAVCQETGGLMCPKRPGRGQSSHLILGAREAALAAFALRSSTE
jgi:hypothetical protein